MRGSDDRNLVIFYIALAAGVATLGTGITFALLAYCAYQKIDVTLHWWLLGIPVFASLFINVFLIELYRRLTRKY
jgi:hypothetical protein